MQHLVGWAHRHSGNPSTNLICSELGQDAPSSLLEGGHYYRSIHYPTYNLVHRVWQEVSRVMGFEDLKECALIWGNRSLEEIHKTGQMALWTEEGMTRLCQLYHGGFLKTFRHWLKNFCCPNLHISPTYVCVMLCLHRRIGEICHLKTCPYWLESSFKKSLIATTYLALLHASLGSSRLPCFRTWVLHVGEIEEEKWGK